MARNAMRTVSLRTIAQHRLRLGLTVLAVILGTAFVSGSFMFTTSLSNTFDAAVNNVYRGVDVGVGDGVGEKDGDGPPLDASMRDRLAQDSLVREVNVLSPQPVVIANEDAVAYQTQGDTSEVIAYYPPEQTVGEENALVQGHAPRGTGEVLVSESAVEDYGIGLGDRLMLVHPEHRDTVTVVGVSAPASQLGDDITISMAAPAFLDLYGDPVQLKLSAAEGTTAEDLAQHLSSTYDVEAETGEALADAAREEMAFALTAIRYLLIAFGLIALLVGTFIIANTFSMIVAQRTKEFALLRALGASQPQVVGSVVVESAIVGIFGSLVGVATGIGLVALIKAVMGTQGMPFEPGLGISPAAIIVPLVLGVLVTTLSAYAPARRAGSVQPVEAMRGTDAEAPASLRRRTIAGVVLAVVGIVAASAGAIIDASTNPRVTAVGIGAACLIVGVYLAGPALSSVVVPGLGKVVGAPFGAIGSLAGTNTHRNPRRTAATAFALILGVALVTVIGMLGATMKASLQDDIADHISADYVLTGPVNGNFSAPNDTVAMVEGVDGIDARVTVGAVPATVGGQSSLEEQAQLTMTVDADPTQVFALELKDGDHDIAGGFLADEELATEQGWKVGRAYEVAGPVPGMTAQATLRGTYEPTEVATRILLDAEVANQVAPPEAQLVRIVGIVAEDGADRDAMRADLEVAVRDAVVLQVMTGDEYATQLAGKIDQMLAVLYGLLALAVIIAVLGIINTLTLGVIERRKEIGMLRAVGTQRRQVRTMITLESVQIAVFGAFAGVVLGLGLGAAFIATLADEGFDSPQVPWALVGVMLVGSAGVGVIAALWPSQHAAKTPPLDAIAVS